jgi:hypothetical protein
MREGVHPVILERLEGLRCRQDLAHDRFGSLKYGAWRRAPIVLGRPSIVFETLKFEGSGRVLVYRRSLLLDREDVFIAELHVSDERPSAGVTALAKNLDDRIQETLESGYRDHGRLI